MFAFRVLFNPDEPDNEPILSEFYFDMSKVIAVEEFDKSLPQDFVKGDETPIQAWLYLEGYDEPLLISMIQNDLHYVLYYLKQREMCSCNKLANDLASIMSKSNECNCPECQAERARSQSLGELPTEFAVMLKRKPDLNADADKIQTIQKKDRSWIESHQNDLAEIAEFAKKRGLPIVIDLDTDDKLSS